MNSTSDKNWSLPATYTRIARYAGLMFGLQALQRLLGLVTTYFVVRVLSQESFGNYQFVLSAIGVVSILAMPGLNNAVMQSVARGKRGTYRASIRPAFLGSLAGGVVLVCIGSWYYFVSHNGLSSSFFVATLVFPFAYGLTQWKGLRSGLEDFVGVVKLEGAASIATSLLLVGAVLYVTGSFVVLVVIILAVQAVLNVLATRSSLGRVKRDEPVEKGSIRYGLVTTGFMVLGHVALYVDKLLIYAFMTPASLAIFVAAERLPELVKGVVKNVGAALAPRFARHTHYTRRVDRAIKAFSIIAGAAIVVFAFTLLPWLLVMIFGEDYRESIPYAQALMCSVALVSSLPLKTRFIKSQQDSASFRDTSTIMAVIRIAASSALIPFFGLKGAVISAILSRIGNIVTVHYVMKKRYPVKDDDG